MTKINTVLGTIDSSELGYTLVHEHMAMAPMDFYEHHPEVREADFTCKIYGELQMAKEGGVNTIIDASPFDLGQDIKLLVKAARQTGLNFICCTGWWQSDQDAYYNNWSIDKFAELFVKEIKKDIRGSGVKAGILKSAADSGGVTKKGEPMLRAVARAQLKTGVPIMLHSYSPGKVGTQQLEILKQEGVNPKWVKIDHSLDTTDTDYLCSLLDQGCYLGMDRLPGWTITLEQQARVVKKLMDAGWAHRLLFAHDAFIALYYPETPVEVSTRVFNPLGKLVFIKNTFFPMLHNLGVPMDMLDRFCIDNPRNFFEGK